MTTLESLLMKFPGGFTTSEFRGQSRIAITAEKSHGLLFELMSHLKSECGFDYLCDLTCVDYLNYPKAMADRFGIVYALTNLATGERIFVKAFVNDPDPELPSVVELWNGADWMEREVYDMYGVRFTGHPDLRRILMPSEFEAFPLRKDYPLRGYGERHNFQTITRSES
jgi:NADH-quinone oxidoreductase subunit C